MIDDAVVDRQSLPIDTLRVYVAFEGGGAKGVAHVGALKALERKEFDVRGYSGTSAGAIIATLAAAGFRSDELIDFANRRTLLDWLRERGASDLRKATDLFGGKWWRVRLFRWVVGRFDSGGVTMRLTQFHLLLLYVLAMVVVLGVPGAAAVIGPVLVRVAFGAVGLAKYLLRGMTRLRLFRATLNSALCLKLGLPLSHTVTFGDLRARRDVSLKIVAADLGARRLRLFSTEHEEDARESLADAVAASICLPIIFVPWAIRGVRHVDGGLVSNLPVWPFDEDRALDPDAKTIAVEIEDKPRRERAARDRAWLVDIVRTALFGAQILNKRAVDGLHVVKLTTRLDVLDFDAGERVFEEVRNAASQVSEQIRRRILDGPALARATNRVVMDYVRERLVAQGKEQRVRIAIARPDGDHVRSLRLRHCVGFKDACDESLLLPIDRSVVGEAWRKRSALLVERPQSTENWLNDPRDRWARKRVPDDLNWILTVPILYASHDTDSGAITYQPSFVVSVDGNGEPPGEREADDEVFLEMVEAVASAYELIRPYVEELEDA